MRATIAKLMRSIFPELAGGYHLPIKARIVAIADEPTQPSLSDQFRPHYAVDVLPLLPNDEPNEALGVFEGLPLPMTGHSYALPKIGQCVELSFFNGLPSQPFIRSIRPEGELLPAHHRGESVQHHSLDSFNKIDSAGNHHRKTQGDIHDEALKKICEALEFIGIYKSRLITNTGDDTEEIKGSKLIEVLGTLDALSGENMSLGTLKKLHLLANDTALLEAKNQTELKSKKIKIGNGTDELLSLVDDLASQVATLITDVTALQTAYNTHNHNKSVPMPLNIVTPTTATVATMKSSLGNIKT